MVTSLLPERHVLTKPQLAVALGLAKLTPSERSALPADLPKPAGGAASLSGTSLLGEDNKLTAEATAMLEVLADPLRLLSVTMNRAGSRLWTEASMVSRESTGPYVLQADDREGGFDFALLPSQAQALLTIDGMLSLTTLPTKISADTVALDLAAYAAALALSDVMQASLLRSKLARRAQPEPIITAEVLEEELARGLGELDTRWAVTAARALCPADLTSARGKMAEGIDALVGHGLLSEAEGKHRLTDQGFNFVGAFGHLLNSATLVLATEESGKQMTAGYAGIFRSSNSIWTVQWDVASGDQATAHLTEASADGALALIRAFLSPPAYEPSGKTAVAAQAPAAAAVVCPNCGASNEPTDRFCHHCGTALSV